MAQCILCKEKIPDGTQYCKNCYSEVKSKADETYLDSLLSSVTSPDNKSMNLDRSVLRTRQQHKDEKRNNMNDNILDGVPSDYNIFSKSDDDSDLDFLNGLFDQAIENATSEDNRMESTLETDVDSLPEIVVTKEANIEEVTTAEPTIHDSMNDEFLNDESELEDSVVGEPMINMAPEIPSTEEILENPTKEQLDLESFDKLDSDIDLLDLINEINNSEELPSIEDITNDGDSLGNGYHTEQELDRKATSDIGDVFSEALSAVTLLQDNDDIPMTDDDLINMIPDIDIGEVASNQDSKSNQDSPKSPKSKSIFSRLFGNIKEERTEEEIQQLMQKTNEEAERKEEAKAKKELAKAQKAENAQKAKEEAKQKKLAKEKQAKAKKEAKERRSREIQELVDEIDENEGKINKVGAGIVFAWFAAIAVIVVVGTNIYSYSLAIKHAKNNFEIQHYNEAYKNVYGIDIKDEDIEIYDKIMTVMFVNKQLNSYENYYNMKKYPQALDSLLKGLERYDKYYSLAGLLGIESDLDYVRNEILEKLDTTFDISEEEADALLAYDDQQEYSEAIYQLLSNRIKVSVDDNED